MIVQVAAPVKFTEASRIVVALAAPSRPQTHIAVAVTMTGGRTAGLRMSDHGSTSRWRMANGDGGPRALWYRVGGPQGGVQEILIETAHQVEITGTAVAAEVAGVSPGAACDALSNLLAGGA
jgi:hypothetical protein